MARRGGSGTRRLAQEMMAREQADQRDFQDFYQAISTTGETPQTDGDSDNDAVSVAMVLAYDGNVADLLDDHTLNEIGEAVEREYTLDEETRKEWVEMAKEGLKAAAQKKPEAKNTPYPSASNVKFPLLTTACIQFAARAYPAIVRGDEVIDAKVSGEDAKGEKAKRARRSASYANDQLIYRCTEWEKGTDSLLHALPAIGKAFRKVYWDASLGRPRLDYVSALDVVVAADAPSIDLAPRITHVVRKYPYEIERLIRNQVWREHDFNSDASDKQKPVEYLEQCRYCDLDEDGLSEPYIVTIHKDRKTVVRIDPAYDIEDVNVRLTVDPETGEDREEIVSINRVLQWVDYDFLPDTEGGFYAMGFGQLLMPISAAIDTTINELLDAGQLQNTNTGFIIGGAQFKSRSGELTLKHNAFKMLPGGGNIRDSIYRMEFPGPSQALMALLEFLVGAAKDITSIKDVLTGESPATAPATSTLALIEQGLQVFSAIYKRVYRSMTREFELLYALNKRYLSSEEYNRYLDAQPPEAEISAAAGDPSATAGEQAAAQSPVGLPAPQQQGGEVIPFPGPGPAQQPQPQGPMAAGQNPQATPADAGAGGPAAGGMGLSLPPQPGAMPPMQPSDPGGFLPPDPGILQAQLAQPQQFDPAHDFDLSDMDIRPVADPTAVTEMQRLARAQFLDQMRQTNPYINGIEATKRILEAARLEEPDKLVIEQNPIADAQAQAQLQLVQNQAALAGAQAALAGAEAQHMGADLPLKQKELALKEQDQALKQQDFTIRQQQAERDAAARERELGHKDHERHLAQLEFDFSSQERAMRLGLENQDRQIARHQAAMDETERGARIEIDKTTAENDIRVAQAQHERDEAMLELKQMMAQFDAENAKLDMLKKQIEADRAQMESDYKKRMQELEESFVKREQASKEKIAKSQEGVEAAKQKQAEREAEAAASKIERDEASAEAIMAHMKEMLSAMTELVKVIQKQAPEAAKPRKPKGDA